VPPSATHVIADCGDEDACSSPDLPKSTKEPLDSSTTLFTSCTSFGTWASLTSGSLQTSSSFRDSEFGHEDTPALTSSSASKQEGDNKKQERLKTTCGKQRRLSQASASRLQRLAGMPASRHIDWNEAGIVKLIAAGLLDHATEAAVDGYTCKAMHPARARAGYQMLLRMKALVETHDLDDCGGMAIVDKQLFDSIPRKHIEVKSIEQVLRVDLLERFLRKVIEEAASVEVCWHGTQEKNVEAIVRGGLKPSLCATGAYGCGAYVGAHAGIAHQYADPNESGWRHMCCTLTVVGSLLVKGVEGCQSDTTSCDRLVNPTQYCFQEEERLYISHVITYRVVEMKARRTGGGFEDPFLRKLEGAMCRAARNRCKVGLR